ncbi:hypothetical protein B0H14DRAFT_2732117 [Mycena olivaceomarginata]|nr:hypothetical protein B0H14DRAFT_2732117 [Mycena olivaceomarginata]
MNKSPQRTAFGTSTWQISSDVLASPSESATWSPSFTCCGGRRSDWRRCGAVRWNDSGFQAPGDGLLEVVGAWTVLLRIGYYQPNFFRHGDTYGGETGSLVEPDTFRHGGTYGGASRARLFDAAIPMARLVRYWTPLDNVDTYSGEAGSLAPSQFWVLGDLSFSSGVYLVTCGRWERTGIFPSTSGGTCMPHWGLGDNITFCSPS